MRAYLLFDRVFRHDILPLRGLVEGLAPGQHSDELPIWYKMGNANTAYAESGYSPRKVHAITRTLYPALAGQFASAGIPPYLPRALGGAGLVRPGRSLRSSNVHRRSLACLLWGQKFGKPEFSYERIWSLYSFDDLSRFAEEDIDHCIADYRLLPYGSDPPKGLVNLGRLDDVRLRGVAWSAAAMGVDARAIRPRFFDLVRAHGRVKEALLKSWLSAKPVRKSVDACMCIWRDKKDVEVFAPLGAYTGPGMAPSEDVLNEHAFLAFPRLLAPVRDLASRALLDHWEFSFLMAQHSPGPKLSRR